VRASSWFHVFRQPGGSVLGLLLLWLGIQIGGFIPLMPMLVSQFGGLDKNQITVFFLINILTSIAVSFAAGHLSDGQMRRSVLALAAGCLGTAGNFGLTLTKSAPLLDVLGALSVCNVVLFSLYFAVAKGEVVRSFSPAEQVVATTVLRTLVSLGFVIGTGLSAPLLLLTDVKTIYRVLSATGLTLTLATFLLFLRFERHPHAAPAEHGASLGEGGFSWKTLLVPMTAAALMNGADRLRLVYLPLVAFDTFHDAALAPQLFSLAAGLEIITMAVLGALAARIGEPRIIFGGALAGAVSFVLCAVLPWPSAYYAANVLYSVFAGALQGVTMAYLQHQARGRPGLGSALFLFATNVGALTGVVLPLTVPGYQPALFFLGAALCVGASALLLPAWFRRLTNAPRV